MNQRNHSLLSRHMCMFIRHVHGQNSLDNSVNIMYSKIPKTAPDDPWLGRTDYEWK